jgi:hypothetical protein
VYYSVADKPIGIYAASLTAMAVAMTQPFATHAEILLPPKLSTCTTVLGANPFDLAAEAVAAGDINGDGWLDLVMVLGISGPLEFVVAWGPVPCDTVDLSNPNVETTQFVGTAGGTGGFAAVACLDFNRDGFDDIAVGAMTYDYGNGRTYVVFGRPTFPGVVSLATPAPVQVLLLRGVDGSGLGWCIATGDVNGDTYDDLVASAPGSYSGGGEVYILYGQDSLPPEIDFSDPVPEATRVIEPALYQGAGKSLACKDVDDDGFDDVLIGSPGDAFGYFAGKATLLYGTDALADTVLLSDPSVQAVSIYPELTVGFLGGAVGIGDMNEDGFDDLVVSAYGLRTVYVIDGHEMPDSINVGAPGTLITRILGSGQQYFGVRLACGDLMGNGHCDIALTNDAAVTSDTACIVTILEGNSQWPDTVFADVDTSLMRIFGLPSDDLGHDMYFADFTHDDVMDLVIPETRADPLGRKNAGIVYVLSHGPVSDAGVATPASTALDQNYPNPFNPTTTIAYSIASRSRVQLRIYNVRGQLVKTLVDDEQVPNVYRAVWDGRNNSGSPVASGVYFYELVAGDFQATKKMVLVR